MINQWALNNSSGPIIILPGRITPLKGHDVLVKALATLKNLPWTCVLIGDPVENPGTTRNLSEMINGYGLEDRIKFGGHCSDMAAACQLADIVVSATSTKPEAFGRIAVEAGAMAKPVIASAHGGSLETIIPGKTGWLVEPSSSKSLANALNEAIGNMDLCKKLGEQGQKRVRENFTTEKMCQKTLKLYQKVLTDSKLN